MIEQLKPLFRENILLPYLYTAFVIFIFFIPTVSNILLVAFLIIWFLSNDFKNKLKIILNDGILIAFIAFYCLYIVGSFYTQNLQDAYQALSIKLPLLLLPILIGTINNPVNKTEMQTIMTTYVLSSIACSLYLLFAASMHATSLNVNLVSYLLSVSDHEVIELSKLKNHRPYLGLFVAFATLLLTYKDSTYFKQHTLRFGIIVFLLLSLFFLFKAKMSVLAVVIALAIRYFPSHNYLRLGILLITLLTSILFHKSIINFAYNKIILSDGGSRVRNWDTSLDAISESPLLGHGSGDEILTLQNFRAQGSWEHIYAYNSHNQYLSITIQLGILGLAILLFILYSLFRRSLRYYPPGIYMVFIFALACLSEVLLSRNAGVLFIGFFSGLIISHCRFLSKNTILTNARYS